MTIEEQREKVRAQIAETRSEIVRLEMDLAALEGYVRSLRQSMADPRMPAKDRARIFHMADMAETHCAEVNRRISSACSAVQRAEVDLAASEGRSAAPRWAR
jgi:chromosome segregation ATPase